MFTILVVEDDERMREKIKGVIAFMSEVKVLAAENIEKAWEFIEGVAIDIFIIDIKLPDGCGIELARKLRKTHPFHPIIIESTEKEPRYQAEIHDEIGNIAFLGKPYNWERFQIKVKQAFDIAERLSCKMIAIEQGSYVEFFVLSDIVYVETVKGLKRLQVTLYNKELKRLEKTILKGVTMGQFIEALPVKNALIRCHNSFIVNPQMLQRWHTSYPYELILKYDIKIPVGRSYRNRISLGV